MRGVNNSVDTVNAAATAIISAESRVQQVTVPRRRWKAFFSVYWCFGSQRHTKRINHAVLVPEPTPAGPNASMPENQNHQPVVSLPFLAPPSSPASFLNSEPPSSTQSPAAFLSLSALSANAYSSPGPSMFTIGPYANEPQLVSPPVFSTFTTEPSTAPFTPPPESVQLTTPSSPEVPFARLLTSSFDSNCKKSEAYEFQSYHLYPGSPIGYLISPSSVCSGTSSPFPDQEFQSSVGAPPKILTADGLADRKLIPRRAPRDNGSILDGQIAEIMPQIDEPVVSQRVSFELTAEEVARCLGKKATISAEATSESLLSKSDAMAERDLSENEAANVGRGHDEINDELPEKLPTSGELAAGKEFKFSNSDKAAAEPSVGTEWWVNEKVVGAEAVPPENWAFFPMIQPGVS